MAPTYLQGVVVANAAVEGHAVAMINHAVNVVDSEEAAVEAAPMTHGVGTPKEALQRDSTVIEPQEINLQSILFSVRC